MYKNEHLKLSLYISGVSLESHILGGNQWKSQLKS